MSTEREASTPTGEWIECGACYHGTVAVYSARDFEGPGECRHCNAGQIWRYTNGTLALYPGGPFVGRDSARLPSSGSADA